MKRMRATHLTRRANVSVRLLMRTASGLSTAWLAAATRATAGAPARPAVRARDCVEEVIDFGRNPGELRMFVYVPPRLPAPNGPLVLVLHGCGQGAESFAADAGWIGLARRLGLPIVLPEQVRANNRAGCFNWFEPEDFRRDGGEAASIRQMVRVAARRFRTHPKKVFIVGFSAGGAMTAAMLAAYPATFAAGAIVAGMPVGVAHGMGGAILRMRQANTFMSNTRLADAVRARAPGRRSVAWPRVSIWQGDQDRIVDPANAAVLTAQFGALHGCNEVPDRVEQVLRGVVRLVWEASALPRVELWTLAGMGHGFPIDGSVAGGGRAGAAVHDIGLGGAGLIAGFFGLGR